MHDVVIVGASLTGSATAIHLARMGHSVLLMDRGAFPRRKSCGEGLFGRGVEALDRLGVLEHLMPRAAVLESLRIRVEGATVEAALQSQPFPTVGIRRELLDQALLEEAVGSGVDVHLNVTARGLQRDVGGYSAVVADQGTFRARAFIAADGLRSRLRMQAGLDAGTAGNRYGVSAHFLLPAKAHPRIDIHSHPSREVYVTPVDESTVNVALLFGKDRALELGGNLMHSFSSMIEASGALPEGAQLVDEPLATGPFPAAARRLWRDNLLLAGDAAGFFDGISGEGMSLALVSAADAARAIHGYLEDGIPRHFAAYERRRRSLERNSNVLARVSLFLSARPRLARYVVSNLAKHPATFQKLVSINTGASGFGTLHPRDAMALFLGR